MTNWPKVLSCFPDSAGKPFRPSNGTSGDIFETAFCSCCLHEKYIHTGDTNDKTCDILTAVMCYDTKDPEYPKEWVYNAEGWPICTAWQKWDWNRDDDDNWNDPPVPEPEDPNQLVLPFIIEDVPVFNKQAILK